MKKIKPRLQLTKTTVRVLRDAELTEILGGGAPRLAARSSADPFACVVGDAYGADSAKKL